MPKVKELILELDNGDKMHCFIQDEETNEFKLVANVPSFASKKEPYSPDANTVWELGMENVRHPPVMSYQLDASFTVSVYSLEKGPTKR
jgi:hypothetical protein